MSEDKRSLIYVVDDEPNIRKLASLALREYGFETQEFAGGEELLKAVQRRLPDVIVLDWVMPAPDGLSICGRLKLDKDTKTVPIILLTARNDEVDCVLGLEMGADDYVTKPFQPMELLARVNSHLRRYARYMEIANAKDMEANKNIYTIGGLELNEDTKEVRVDGELTKFTPIEFKILSLLMRNPGRVFSADEIYERVWNECAINTDTVMVHVRNIREKIEYNPKEPKYLKVVWGVG